MPVFRIRHLLRHRLIGLLVVAQATLVCAVLGNVALILGDVARRTGTPSGLDEPHIGVIATRYLGQATPRAIVAGDLRRLEAMPGVSGAATVSALPLTGGSDTVGLCREVGANGAQTRCLDTEVFNGSPGYMRVLGVRILSGRAFSLSDYAGRPHAVILTRSLAQRLFPSVEALGQVLRSNGTTLRVVAVASDLARPSIKGLPSDRMIMFLPHAPAGRAAMFVLQTRAVVDRRLLDRGKARLLAEDPDQLIDTAGMLTFREIRAHYFAKERGLVGVSAWFGGGLLLLAGIGIYGLSNLWVTRRRAAMGIQRALGATRRQIVGSILFENAVLTLPGIVLGGALGLAFNTVLRQAYEIGPLPLTDLLFGAVLTLVVGQVAACRPALAAGSMSPMAAIGK